MTQLSRTTFPLFMRGKTVCTACADCLSSVQGLSPFFRMAHAEVVAVEELTVWSARNLDNQTREEQ